MRASIRTAAVLCGATLWSMANAQGSVFVVDHSLCSATQLPQSQSMVRTTRIGCDIVDATLGCPPDMPLFLKVNFEAPAGSIATLVLTDAPNGLLPAVGEKLGTLERVNASTFRVAPGLGYMEGFISNASPAPQVSISVEVPPAMLTVGNTWLRGPESAGLVKVELTQSVRGYAVDRTAVRHYYYPCSDPQSSDSIKVTGATNGSVALVDAKGETTCGPPYDGYLGKENIGLPNLHARGSCLERLMLYSPTGAMTFEKNMQFWKNDAGDEKTVEPSAFAVQRLRVWVLYDKCRTPKPSTCSKQEAEEVAEAPTRHLENARRVYRQQFAGITFEATINDTILASRNGRKTVHPFGDGDDLQCSDPASTSSTVGKLRDFTGLSPTDYKKQLNVFYVKDPGPYGQWCGEYDAYGDGRDTILIGSDALPGTLAHELGHALLWSGDHVAANVGGFSLAHSQNLMTRPAIGEQFTLGQLFRANLSPQSTVNRHDDGRSGDTANCLTGTADSCPELPLDVTPR